MPGRINRAWNDFYTLNTNVSTMKLKQSGFADREKYIKIAHMALDRVTRQPDFQESFRNISVSAIDISKIKAVQSDAISAHKSRSRRTRYFIYQCGGKFVMCGGWADRLKGIVIAYLISRVTNRTFGISITHPPCDLQRYILPNQVAWNINIPDVTLKSRRNNVRYYQATNNRSFYQSIPKMDFNKFFKQDIVYFQANLDYVDNFKNNSLYTNQNVWLANLTRDEIYTKVYHQLFSLPRDIQSELATFLKFAKPSSSHQLVCAHVRAKINIRHMMSQPDFSKVWRFLNQYNDPDKYRIYVTSDSDHIRTEAHERFGNILVDNVGPLVHIDKIKNSTDCEGMKKVILDQNILMNCDILLLTFSGFSRMAAYLREKKSGLFCLVKHKIVTCSAHSLKELYRVSG